MNMLGGCERLKVVKVSWEMVFGTAKRGVAFCRMKGRFVQTRGVTREFMG